MLRGMSKPEKLNATLDAFELRYGKLVSWTLRLMLIPFLWVSIYAGNAYLNSHFVSKAYYDASVATTLAAQLEETKSIKAQFVTVNGKLDVILIQNATSGQKIADNERRTTSLESRVDRLQEKRP